MKGKPCLSVAILACGLIACGGGGARSFSTPQEIATELGCANFSADEFNPVAKASGDCDLNGENVKITTFSNNDQYGTWKEAVARIGGAFGGVHGSNVVGDKWVVSTQEQAKADQIKAKLGGRIEKI